MIAGVATPQEVWMRKLARGAIWLTLLVLPMTSRGDTGSGSDDSDDVNDSTPDVTQLDPGPSSALWHRADLSPAEQAYVDRARNPAGRDPVDAAYAAAIAEHIPIYEAQAAAAQLGIDGLDQEGVVQ